MVPEWLSFSNEFFPSSHISMYMYLFKWYRNEIAFSYKSSSIESIPVFNPNEILFLVRNLILASFKLKRNFLHISCCCLSCDFLVDFCSLRSSSVLPSMYTCRFLWNIQTLFELWLPKCNPALFINYIYFDEQPQSIT